MEALVQENKSLVQKNEELVQRNIEGVIDRLKYLETKECRREMSKEQLDRSKKFATEMFRSLLIHRDNIKGKKINEVKCDLYY
jgi:hypothetical protein